MLSLIGLITLILHAYSQVPCGDHSTYCPSGSTCCPLDSNTRYGCCPIPEAVCCEDKLHCCPSGMQCDTAHAQCTNGELKLPFYKKSKAIRNSHESNRKAGVPLEASQRKCLNGDVCSGGSKCCYDQDKNEAYCCPEINGQCCSGGKKCCKKGFVCSTYGDECIREKHGVIITTQMLEAELADEAHIHHRKLTICPDNTKCPHKNTCCSEDGKTYRCCALKNATCCGSYCCSDGYDCSFDGQCEKSDFLFN